MRDREPNSRAAQFPDLSGRVVLVTGGTSGIGKASAEAFLRSGAVVAITGRSREKGSAALDELTSVGRARESVMFVPADVTREADVAALITAVVDRFGGLHVAVNSAANTEVAVGSGSTFTDMSLEVFDGVVRTCLTSVWLCMKHELTAILASGGGSIINLSSVDALLAAPGTGSYAAAKAGVNALSRAAAAEYASQGVRVNVISPGAIETPMLAANLAAGSAEERDATMARYLSMIDSRRLGMPEELAAAVVWLASDQASYVVGHNLVVDGGIRGD
jgi:NAD(P)-dependent dehydrogenase (short-subunit alcohol dehydrogenase family)